MSNLTSLTFPFVLDIENEVKVIHCFVNNIDVAINSDNEIEDIDYNFTLKFLNGETTTVQDENLDNLRDLIYNKIRDFYE